MPIETVDAHILAIILLILIAGVSHVAPVGLLYLCGKKYKS